MLTQRPQGFSLLEMLICLMLVGFITLFTYPNYSQFLFSAQAQSASAQILRGINFARSEARLRGETIGFCKSSDHLTCGGRWEDGQLLFVDGMKKSDPERIMILESLDGSGKLHWRSALGKEYLQLLPSGFTNGEQGTFWYCHKKGKMPTWAIVVNHAGRARLIYPYVSGDIKDITC